MVKIKKELTASEGNDEQKVEPSFTTGGAENQCSLHEYQCEKHSKKNPQSRVNCMM